MGSKVIGFRVPDDLAEELERFSSEHGQTTGEFLRKLVDDTLYPGSGRQRLEKRRTVGADEALSGVISGLAEVRAQLNGLEQQVKSFDERLELVRVDRGLTAADKEHYDGALVELESGLANLKVGVNKLVQAVNNNVEVCNESFKRVSLLFQFLADHTHDGDGVVKVTSKELLKAEVQLANKRIGELPDTDEIKLGKVSKPGWKYLEHLNLSVRK